MNDKPNIEEALHAIETLDDFIVGVRNCLEPFVREEILPEKMRAYVIHDGQSDGVDLVINPLAPKDRVKIVHEGQYIANIHVDDFDDY